MTTSLIGIDWGSTHLRAYRYGTHGEVLESRALPHGVRKLPVGGFAEAFALAVHAWPDVPVISCGMVGSRNGWLEVPYLATPANAADLAHALSVMTTPDGRRLHLVPGLRDPQRPDVMRGEETQIAGVLAQHQEPRWHGTLLLPGTHSKWATISDGMVSGFATMMTGELYGLLTTYSSLCAQPPAGHEQDAAAFAQGVLAARDSGPAGGLAQLFSARVRMLDGVLAPASVPDYLSGLLIGDELRMAAANDWIDAATPVQIVGDVVLCARYLKAARLFGFQAITTPDSTTSLGLWHIAATAGLVASSPE
ncbi:2-dehydro-3-deoxygalactonokinase [Dyella sp. Tek66A03]|uniref:2-dehydro-3-deoxygalactonokinase n=1 Tax=Dyella sp. Tek66A03 TaxID=3458298 RepID=UPI00403EF2EF